MRRVPAAARCRRAAARAERSLPTNPRLARGLEGRTLFLPRWDALSCTLVAANLERMGVKVELLSEDPGAIERSLHFNSGQCLPLSIVAQEFIEAVETRGLDPASTALWMAKSRISCNLGIFPSILKTTLESWGRGFERAAVYVGELSCREFSLSGAVDTYLAYLFGGMLRRLALPGAAVRAAAKGRATRRPRPACASSGRRSSGSAAKLEAVEEVVERFRSIEQRRRDRPKVAIFGDIYVRDNDVMSQDLIRFIEEQGGEVITTPYSEYIKIIADCYLGRWLREGQLLNVVVHRALLATVKMLERKYAERFARVLGPAVAKPQRSAGEMLELFRVSERHTGESLDNVLKLFHLIAAYPDISLFVQANPASCCPSLVTEAMSRRIEEVTGVPVATVTYDGSPGSKNEPLIPYLRFPRRRAQGMERQA